MRQPKLRALVLGIYALAMVLMGFLHQPIATLADAPDEAPSAYTLPDGTVLPVCRGLGEQAPVGTDHHAKLCDACLLAGGHGLASSPCALLRPAFSVSVPALPLQQIGKAGIARTRFAARAPPANDPQNT
jgi:hypothetical protein